MLLLCLMQLIMLAHYNKVCYCFERLGQPSATLSVVSAVVESNIIHVCP